IFFSPLFEVTVMIPKLYLKQATPLQGVATAQAAVPVVYVMTPTFRRATQAPDLIRVAQSLMLTTAVFWIVHSVWIHIQVSRIVKESGVPFVHLLGPCPKNRRNPGHGRGVSGRLRGLDWLRKHAALPGVLYFADDDNSYDHRLFDEIRWTRAVSVFPVGAIQKTGVSSPVVVGGRVVEFYDPMRKPWRKFPVDMAGFAVNLRLVMGSNKLQMPYQAGHLETAFLESLNITIRDLEPLCENATKIFVWHTQSKPGVFPLHSLVRKVSHFNQSNMNKLLTFMNS
ncbi:unnamed protein product, partial [Ixodes persulcatus]